MSPTPPVVRGFRPPSEPWGPGHRGVDLAAKPGSAVRAAGPGRVSYAGRLAGRGVVAVDHGELRTTYLPVRATVRVGQHVPAGQRIGVLESLPRHCPQLPHPQTCLHWGLLRGDTYLDPLRLVRDTRVRLLPVWGRPSPTGMPGAPDPGGLAAGAGRGEARGDAPPPESPETSTIPSPAPTIDPGPVRPELVNSALVGGGTAGATFMLLLLASRLRGDTLRNLIRRRRPPSPTTRNVIDFTTARKRRNRRPPPNPDQDPA